MNFLTFSGTRDLQLFFVCDVDSASESIVGVFEGGGKFVGSGSWVLIG